MSGNYENLNVTGLYQRVYRIQVNWDQLPENASFQVRDWASRFDGAVRESKKTANRLRSWLKGVGISAYVEEGVIDFTAHMEDLYERGYDFTPEDLAEYERYEEEKAVLRMSSSPQPEPGVVMAFEPPF